MLHLLLLLLLESNVETNLFPSEANPVKTEHKEHYRVNQFNQLADDARTVHTEDFHDYGNEDTDYIEPEYNEDYFVDDEEDTKLKPPANPSQITDSKIAQGEHQGRNASSNDVKWFNKQYTNQSNEKRIPEYRSIPTKPPFKIPVANTPPSNSPSAPPFNGIANEAQVKNNSNIYSRIKNIKENANRLNNEKIIYADEKFLLLKFKLTPLNESNVQPILHDDIDDGVDKNKLRERPKDLELFDSSIFDEDDSFFNSFEDTREDHSPFSNYERKPQRKGSHLQGKKYLGHPGGDRYKTGRGFWIGNKYYPYHGPGFRHHHYDFSDEDFSSDSDYSEDCSDEYEDSNEDPGILYGKPVPGVPVPTRGPGVVIYQGPGVPNIPGGVPNIPSGVLPPATPGKDTGILYGDPGQPGVIPGSVRTSNNTDVVLLVIAPQ